MQNVAQGPSSDIQKLEKVNVQHDIGKSSTPISSNSSPTKSETETYSELQPRFMSDSSESEEDDVSEVESFVIDQAELDEETRLETSKFLLSPEENTEHSVDPETQARLEALLEAAGIGKLSAGDGKHLADPEVLRRLTSSVSCALDEAAAALTRMRSDNPRQQTETRSLVEACTDGDVGTVRKLLTEGRSVHETTEEGESLLSLACSAGYYELAQVLLAMHANVEDRGIKGDCTPLMEAASAGHVDIVKLLIAHSADVNAQSSSGNTPLMYACAGGHEEVVKTLLQNAANVEDHNENGHTPLMEAASAGHVGVAKILLEHGAGINTHSNEFKESALTLACYKGHLDMVRFLLEAGADQEHKTDEMHTALMEASMDGHVEVARLLLDSGAQVNMPTDSFESPLTLAACGGHVDLAMLLIERGANIEEVNDEGYTPLMEAAREGHEEMVALLLSQGANINAQTEETQETALTLACCGGFTEVADFLIKAGADIELGASTPLMEAAQEGHLELVKFLLESNADVHAQTQTGDTALTYACENGHTDVAELLLQYGADLEHESEGGRTPLMKACRAGHMCTVQFLISKRADVNRQTTNNDHTPLSLACAGGHLAVVELLLAQSADPFHKLKDNSTMLIEAAKGGHTTVVQLLLDYPHSIMMNTPHPHNVPGSSGAVSSGGGLIEVPQPDIHTVTPVPNTGAAKITVSQAGRLVEHLTQQKHNTQKSLLRKSRSSTLMNENNLTSAEVQQVRNQPLGDGGSSTCSPVCLLSKDESALLDKGSTPSLIDVEKAWKQHTTREDQIMQKQQILEELQRVERELQEKGPNQLLLPDGSLGMTATSVVPVVQPLGLNIELNPQSLGTQGMVCTPGIPSTLFHQGPNNTISVHNAFYTGKNPPLPLTAASTSPCLQPSQNALTLVATGRESFITSGPYGPPPVPIGQPQPQATPSSPPQPISASSEVVQSTAISDRPKAKPVSKKEVKNIRKQQQQAYQNALGQQQQQQQQHQQQQQQQQQHVQFHHLNFNHQLQTQVLQQQQAEQHELQQQQQQALLKSSLVAPTSLLPSSHLMVQLTQLDPGMVPASPQQLNQVLQQKHQHLRSLQQQMMPQPNIDHTDLSGLLADQSQHCQLFAPAMPDEGLVDVDKPSKVDDSRLDLDEAMNDMAQTLGSFTLEDVALAAAASDRDELKMPVQHQGQQITASQLDEAINAITQSPVQVGTSQTDVARVEYYVPSSGTQIPGLQVQHGSGLHLQYQQYQLTTGLHVATSGVQSLEVTGGIQITGTGGSPLQTTQILNPRLGSAFQSQLLLQTPQLAFPGQALPPPETGMDVVVTSGNTTQQPPQTQQQPPPPQPPQQQQQSCTAHQVQVATQTQTNDKKGGTSPAPLVIKGKKPRHPLALRQPSNQQTANTPAFNTQNISSNLEWFEKGEVMTRNEKDCNGCEVSGFVAGMAAGLAVGMATHQPGFSCMDVDSETDSNHDTALTLACAGGHEELVELLLSRGADIEHRDKKGFTPLILAATAGHEKVVEILLNHGAEIEAQSERTKDTPLSLACSGGRYEVVELLLTRSANKEHRNVSDYTPLSLAASGGYVNIIKLLLSHGAEINSRTGSKLGISPLMLAAMNGHTAAVKLLLDMGSDINAQIETNRNTALTLACFQGRHEVVSLLLDRKANVEHRAKTGLTPLMEAASGGYVEVGRVLLDKGADVNAPPVPSSRDTALTIAADKGHCRFVELLFSRGALVEVKNKKGNSPLWLAANGGHLNVVELLYNAGADIDSQDNRKVSCLMAAFRKGHMKVVKWMVNHVTQFPSDQEMTRYISTVNDKELLEKCQDCVKIIRAAKDQQAAKANKNASILLEELDMEKTREESKKAAAARKRERKKKKKLEKKEEKRKLHEENKKNEILYQENEQTNKKDDEEENEQQEECETEGSEARCCNDSPGADSPVRNGEVLDKEEGDSGIDANSQGSCSSNDVKSKEKRKDKKKKKGSGSSTTNQPGGSSGKVTEKESSPPIPVVPEPVVSRSVTISKPSRQEQYVISENKDRRTRESDVDNRSSLHEGNVKLVCRNTQPNDRKLKGHLVFEASRPHPAEREDFEATGNETYIPATKGKKNSYLNHYCDNETGPSTTKGGMNTTSPKQGGKREEGWKEVVRKYLNSPFRSKKVSVPLNAISRVIGRGGSNINAIRGATGAHIEVEKQSKGQGERIITIKGSAEATRQAHTLIAALIKDPEVDILQMLPKSAKLSVVSVSSWDKSTSAVPKSKSAAAKTGGSVALQGTSLLGAGPSALLSKSVAAVVGAPVPLFTSLRSASTSKLSGSFPPPVTRGTAPRHVAAAEKRAAAALAAASNTKTTMSYTSAIMTSGRATKIVTSTTTQTFAAKLTETTASSSPLQLPSGVPTSGASNKARLPQSSIPMSVPTQSQSSPPQPQAPSKHLRPLTVTSSPPSVPGQYQMAPSKAPFSSASAVATVSTTTSATASVTTSIPPPAPRSSTPQMQQQQQQQQQPPPSLQTPPPPPPVQQQQQPPQQQQQPQQQQLPEPQQVAVPTPSNTPLEYSLFNDNFTKVAQQSMWGRDSEAKSIMNFASVAATGAPGGGVTNSTVKFLDNVPPQVDAAKAPGYRGNAVCSPVSSKTSSSSTTPPSMALAPGPQYQNASSFSVESCGPCMSIPNKQQPSPAAPVLAVSSAANMEVNQPPFGGRAVFQSGDLPPRVSSAQAVLDHSALYTAGSDQQTQLLKMVPTASDPQLLAPFHPHHHHHHHNPNNTTTVSMSRLNPRAPDFNLHLSNKSQQQQQSTMFTASNYHQRNNVLPPQPSSMQNSAATGLPTILPNISNLSFPLGKSSLGPYHHQPVPGPSPVSNLTPNGQRWPLYTQPYHQPHHPPDVGQLNFSGPMTHLANLAANLPHGAGSGTADLLAGLENGGGIGGATSPAMSPSSPAGGNPGPAGDPGHHKLEDRKIRPIGTERANWKNFVGGVSSAGDPDWMLGGGEPKMWAAAGMGHAMERHQLYRSNPPHYGRLAPTDDLTHMMETPFQHHPENQHSFHNGGTVAALSLMHHSLPIGAPFNVTNTDMGMPDSVKMEAPSWGMGDVQEKQHWHAKWSH